MTVSNHSLVFWFKLFSLHLKCRLVSGQLHTGGVGFRGGIRHAVLHAGRDEREHDECHQTGNSPEIT